MKIALKVQLSSYSRIIFLLALLVAASFTARFLVFLKTPLVLSHPTIIEVYPRDCVFKIGKRLVEAKVLFSPRLFSLGVRLRGVARRIHVGEYEILPGQTPWQIVTKMAKGDLKQYPFQLKPGLVMEEIFEICQSCEKLVFETGEVAKLFRVFSEGFFLPETYYYTKGTKSVEILKRAHQKLNEILIPLWQNRDKSLPFKTPEEAIILASIVEKETKLKEEFEKVSGVYIRRLQKNMPLQADPTVIYGMGKTYKGQLMRSDLLKDTAYNTYTRKGLPPAAIGLPSKQALVAVFFPDKSENLYFVANGKGGHIFSKDFAAHTEAVKQYRARQE